MHHWAVNGHPRLLFWSHVREFAVPTSMIESATVRREAGDWAGACAAARADVDLDLRAAGRARGRRFAATLRADLRHLAPDLLRWHFPRTRPDGLLRPGLTVSLARYTDDDGHEVHLVARTPPAWASAGQRIGLALWAPSGPLSRPGGHPHPRPDRRFRLDLHRHLWDARRTGELRERSGGDPGPGDGHAAHRWAAEAAILLRADGCAGNAVAVRLSSRHRIVLDANGSTARVSALQCTMPLLPDAATWVPPDLELLHAGLIDAERLHPLVRTALLPDAPVPGPRSPDSTAASRLVDCCGATHRIGVADGVLVALDHSPEEIRREELLVALGGNGLPCLRAIDAAHRHPEDLVQVRARLDHGDVEGALAVVEGLLGPDALLRGGQLRDELETAARRKVVHGLYRAGLVQGPAPSTRDSRRSRRRRSTVR
ncbi:hypothetical protein [Lentzea cavernae]|uniref:HEAT repeat domain-containing protein n=1 Tax=Lentzea cavernae TaxID=2020703 RepID=A0ABQ3MF58_9PSEU|nr:hypothetical protein [Lentzea cavernae]GHH40672.1 hypothetical protein GCM10017774_34420 [Lentzea cavernae]